MGADIGPILQHVPQYIVRLYVNVQYLEYFDDTFIRGTDIHGLKYLAVFPSAQFTYYLIIVLVSGDRKGEGGGGGEKGVG